MSEIDWHGVPCTECKSYNLRKHIIEDKNGIIDEYVKCLDCGNEEYLVDDRQIL